MGIGLLSVSKFEIFFICVLGMMPLRTFVDSAQMYFFASVTNVMLLPSMTVTFKTADKASTSALQDGCCAL